MMKYLSLRLTILILLALPLLRSSGVQAQISREKPNKKLIKRIQATKGFLALWKFDELPGQDRKAIGAGNFPLKEMAGEIPRSNEGPLSGFSLQLDGDKFLSLTNAQTKELNLYGPQQGVTVLAWVKWSGQHNAFVGGMWNEYQDGGKRQYGLFVSLPYYNGMSRVCGHISNTGRPTPPFPYSIDYSTSKQEVPKEVWTCVAMTYDGQRIKSFVNGVFLSSEPELIDHTKGFEGYPDGLVQQKNPYAFPDGMGNNGSDFTVGAVLLKRGMGNFFKGLIGGLAVYDRALTDSEIEALSLR